MEPNQERSLISRPSHELAAPPIGANRILGEMVERSLAVANIVNREAALDALVQEAKQLQERSWRKRMSSNNVQAFKLFLQAAQVGHPEAQFRVFQCYCGGYGIPENNSESFAWLCKAAESGFARAQFKLGRRYFDAGYMCEPQEWLVEAFKSHFLGEKLPIPIANANTGEVIIPANRKITATLLRKLADVCDPIDQIAIDPSPAFDILRKIVSDYQSRFTEIFESRRDEREECYARASKWFRKAAEQSYTEAQEPRGLQALMDTYCLWE